MLGHVDMVSLPDDYLDKYMSSKYDAALLASLPFLPSTQLVEELPQMIQAGKSSMIKWILENVEEQSACRINQIGFSTLDLLTRRGPLAQFSDESMYDLISSAVGKGCKWSDPVRIALKDVFKSSLNSIAILHDLGVFTKQDVDTNDALRFVPQSAAVVHYMCGVLGVDMSSPSESDHLSTPLVEALKALHGDESQHSQLKKELVQTLLEDCQVDCDAVLGDFESALTVAVATADMDIIKSVSSRTDFTAEFDSKLIWSSVLASAILTSNDEVFQFIWSTLDQAHLTTSEVIRVDNPFISPMILACSDGFLPALDKMWPVITQDTDGAWYCLTMILTNANNKQDYTTLKSILNRADSESRKQYESAIRSSQDLYESLTQDDLSGESTADSADDSSDEKEDLISLLCDWKFDFNQKIKNPNQYPLEIVVEHGTHRLLQTLLNRCGADPKVGQPLWYLPTNANPVAMAETLCAYEGIAVNIENDGVTLLRHTLFSNLVSINTVSVLILQCNANLDFGESTCQWGQFPGLENLSGNLLDAFIHIDSDFSSHVNRELVPHLLGQGCVGLVDASESRLKWLSIHGPDHLSSRAPQFVEAVGRNPKLFSYVKEEDLLSGVTAVVHFPFATEADQIDLLISAGGFLNDEAFAFLVSIGASVHSKSVNGESALSYTLKAPADTAQELDSKQRIVEAIVSAASFSELTSMLEGASVPVSEMNWLIHVLLTTLKLDGTTASALNNAYAACGASPQFLNVVTQDTVSTDESVAKILRWAKPLVDTAVVDNNVQQRLDEIYREQQHNMEQFKTEFAEQFNVDLANELIQHARGRLRIFFKSQLSSWSQLLSLVDGAQEQIESSVDSTTPDSKGCSPALKLLNAKLSMWSTPNVPEQKEINDILFSLPTLNDIWYPHALDLPLSTWAHVFDRIDSKTESSVNRWIMFYAAAEYLHEDLRRWTSLFSSVKLEDFTSIAESSRDILSEIQSLASDDMWSSQLYKSTHDLTHNLLHARDDAYKSVDEVDMSDIVRSVAADIRCSKSETVQSLQNADTLSFPEFDKVAEAVWQIDTRTLPEARAMLYQRTEAKTLLRDVTDRLRKISTAVTESLAGNAPSDVDDYWPLLYTSGDRPHPTVAFTHSVKMEVDQDDLYESFLNQFDPDLGKLPTIKFKNQIGSDLGGLSKSLYAKLAQSIMEDEQIFEPCRADSTEKCFKKNVPDHKMKLLVQLIAWALRAGQALDLSLPESFYACILSQHGHQFPGVLLHKMNSGKLNEINSYSSILMSNPRDCHQKGICTFVAADLLDLEIPEDPEDLNAFNSMDSWRLWAVIQEMDKFCDSTYGDAMLFYQEHPLMVKQDEDAVASMSPYALKVAVEGEKLDVLDLETVLSQIKFDGAPCELTKTAFIQMIKDAYPTDEGKIFINKLFIFTTSAKLSRSNQMTVQLSVPYEMEKWRMPSARTCFNTLVFNRVKPKSAALRNAKTKDERIEILSKFFREKLDLAVEEVQFLLV
eukprot:GILJ01005372.1.p1 GENE.GILJ01005372.1~~GILJ01005372.1.p1  ORF type:complete len:1647 (+),score=296.47 GILJ01005372.1:456-4943(+)